MPLLSALLLVLLLQPPPMEQQQQASSGGVRLGIGSKAAKKIVAPKIVTSIIDGLKQIYFTKVRMCQGVRYMRVLDVLLLK